MTTSIGGQNIIFGDPRQPKALPLTSPKARWGEFGTETKTLPKGYVRRSGALALPCDILFERDQIVKWFIGAERPKYLAALAPWEGISDLYGQGARGGVSTPAAMNFNFHLLQVNAGENSWENTVAMGLLPELGAYHLDKRANVEAIEVPTYVVASWANMVHTYGTFCAWQKLKSPKWLRIHETWEWPDYYQENNRSDLHAFFDRFLKGIDNGWERTPAVRAKILDTAESVTGSATDLIATAFPPPNLRPRKFYLDSSSGRLDIIYPKSGAASYAKQKTLEYTYKFSQDTTFCGHVEISLALSLQNGNDADIFVQMEKILKNGKVGQQLKIPYERWYQTLLIQTAHRLGLDPVTSVLFYKGPIGQGRVSRRVIDETASHEGLPIPDGTQLNPVKEDEIVLLKPATQPIGMIFRTGESLRFRITGVDPTVFPPVDQAKYNIEGLEDLNEKVSVTVHTGLANGKGSYIVLPVLDNP